MPRGDGMGPMGQGAMTGRGAGYCAGYNAPGFANPMGGGFGMGYGGGRGGRGGRGGYGRRNQFYATGMTGWQRAGMAPGQPMMQPPMQPVDSVEALRAREEALEASLAEVRRRREDLETGRSPA